MRIPASDYAHYIPEQVGEQVRVDHTNCPAGADTRARLYIVRQPDAALAYCHNCGGYGVKSLSRKVRHRDVLQRLVDDYDLSERTVAKVKLPDDTVLSHHLWPAEARAWLYGYHLDDDDIYNYGIGYSPSWGRVILPVYRDGELVFWQGRQIDGGGPKYVSVKGAKKPLFIANSRTYTHNMFVVEDMLSAIRIAKSSSMRAAVALLGTDATDDVIEVVNTVAHNTVWLDNDEAGRRKAPLLIARLKLCKRGKGAVWTLKGNPPQPKNLSPDDLELILKDSKNYAKA